MKTSTYITIMAFAALLTTSTRLLLNPRTFQIASSAPFLPNVYIRAIPPRTSDIKSLLAQTTFLHMSTPDLSWWIIQHWRCKESSLQGCPPNSPASNTQGAASSAFIQQKIQGTILISFTLRTARHFMKPTELLPLHGTRSNPPHYKVFRDGGSVS